MPAQLWTLDSLLTWGRLLTAPVCLDLRAQLRHQHLKKIYRALQLPIKAFLIADVVTVKSRFFFSSASWLFSSFTYLFLLELSVTEVLPKQVIMTVFNLHCRSFDTWTTSHCYDFILFHSFTWVERGFPHPDCFIQCPHYLKTCFMIEFATWCVCSCEYKMKTFWTVTGN